MTDEFAAGPERQPTVSKSAEHAPVRSVEVRADWRARKWARKRMATRCDEGGFPDLAESYRRGDRDESLREDVEAYRAGAAASSDREEELDRHNGVGAGMVIAAALIVRVWGQTVEAEEILNAAGIVSFDDLRKCEVDAYDVWPLRPVLRRILGRPALLGLAKDRGEA